MINSLISRVCLSGCILVGFSTLGGCGSEPTAKDFETDGVIVVIGSGQLKINIDVKEKAPPCTVLGNDCPQDSWCAPPGLTGMPLQCVPAGYTALGAACSAPTDCQAGATCLDFGQGPTCTALCAVANAGQPCSNASTCTKVAPDYGICIPEGASMPDAGAGGGTSTGGTGSYGGGGALGGSTYYGSGGKKPY